MKQLLHNTSRNLIILLSLLVISFTSKAQNISTEGTDFWLGFMPHAGVFSIDLSLFISTSQDTVTGTISVEGVGVVSNFTLGANSSPTFQYTFPDNLEDDVTTAFDGIINNNSIHIQTDQPVSVYALNKATQFSADATIVLPTTTLGKKYYATCHQQFGTSTILVVGVEDNTTIDIVPSATLLTGTPAGQTETITLDQGETYLLSSSGDLTGTELSTNSSSTGDCQNFSVFSGSSLDVVGGACGTSGDHLFQNSYPVTTWGQSYTIMPFQDRTGDLVKVVAAEDNTTISVTGFSPFVLDEGEARQFDAIDVKIASADKPISVTQFSKSAQCGPTSNFGDPFMLTISPNEQLLDEITFIAFPVFDNSFTYYVDIVSPTTGKNSVTLTDETGTSLPLTFIDLSNGFSYAQVTLVNTGEHVITSGEGFIANVYGFGTGISAFESFGYTTGASLNNLSLSITSVDSGQVNIGDTEQLCLGNPISFSIVTNGSFASFEWDMGDGTTYTTPTVEHVYTAPGTYFVSVVASSTGGGCEATQAGLKEIEVIKADFDIQGPVSVCPETEDVVYTAVNAAEEYSYTWSSIGGTIDFVNNDTITIDWGLTNDTASITGIAVNDLGCDDTTRLSVLINNRLEPLAPLGEDSVCYANLSQTYQALLANGNGYEWFVEGGTLVTDPADPFSHITEVIWDTLATERKLWFREFSFSDAICSGLSDTFYLNTILPEIKTQSLTTVDNTCFGNANGSFTFSAQGGVGTLSYIFDNDTVLGNVSATNLMEGNYTVQVLDETLCAVFPIIEIGSPDSIIITPNPNQIQCNGDTTGSIEVILTGGTAPYQYDWGPDYPQDTFFLDQLPPGNYQVDILDANNCPAKSDTIRIREPDAITFSITGIDSVCQFTQSTYTINDLTTATYIWIINSGSIESGQGSKEVTIRWDQVNPNASIQVVSQNSLGCFSDTLPYPITVFEFPKPAAPTGLDSLCFSDTLNVSYSTTPTSGHAYNWFIEGGTLVIDPADPTGASVLVTWNTNTSQKLWSEAYLVADPICAAFSDTLEVTVYNPILAAITVDRVTCFGGNDGQISIIPSSDFPVFNYAWSHDPSLTTGIASNLLAGDYTVTITDSIGCFRTFENTIIQSDAPLTSTLMDLTHVACSGEATGEAKIAITGGTAPYRLQWNDTLAQTSTTITNLTAGTYEVLIVDAIGCELSDTIIITQPSPFSFTLDTLPSRCKVPEGSATIHVSGATPPFQYDWQTANVVNNNSASQLATGNNLVTVTDSSGCEYEVDAYITSKVPEVYFPNSFTPNDDGLNDTFQFIYTCDGDISYTIYNRWGNVVFQTNDMTKAWDGTDGGEQNLPQGVYVYRLYFETVLDGRTFKIEKRGAVNLIR